MKKNPKPKRLKTRTLREDHDDMPGNEPLNRPCLSCVFGRTRCGCALAYGAQS